MNSAAQNPTNLTYWCAFEPVEVVKSDSADPKKQLLGKVRGIATVELPDKVKGDIIDLDTIRTTYLTKSGVFTLEHPRGTLNTVGFPSSARIIPYTTPEGVKTRALEVEGYMYLNDELGAAIFYKSKVMADAGGDRQLGWSLEGPGLVMNKDAEAPTRKVIYHEPKSIAVCLEPAVEYALWSVAASADPGRVIDLSDVRVASQAYVAELQKSVTAVNAQHGVDFEHDTHIVTLLKSYPTLSWAQGEEAVRRIRAAVRTVLGQHKE